MRLSTTVDLKLSTYLTKLPILQADAITVIVIIALLLKSSLLSPPPRKAHVTVRLTIEISNVLMLNESHRLVLRGQASLVLEYFESQRQNE